MDKYICIHGHFYQPPRENPWLNEVELQESAFPYHDWNERITSECYARNTASRILDAQGKIIDIVINYSKMSFNFGPTLLSWLEKKKPETYRAILDADRISREHFSGHGSAMAQAFNHMIMPLCNERDKRTQVIWGIKDFEKRYERKPEGMWLPETAVDLESLDIMAEYGIRFTVLAPHQAKRVKKIEDHGRFKNVTDQTLDTRIPYLCRLPSGRTISIFFYEGSTSKAVAFEGLLRNGEHFAGRLMSFFDKTKNGPQLVNIATDGESYGHHHKFGDMALAYCLYHLEDKQLAKLTNYGEYLKRFPPTHEAEIIENSSWSCVHGIERWRSDCGCSVGMKPGWNQKWRAPLREALDWLREKLIELFEKEMGHFTPDMWNLRDRYIDVILERREENIDRFLKEAFKRELSLDEKIRIIKLLEMQYNALLMYTSCGWFFDDISGIEPVQILRYAARAMQLAKETAGWDLEAEFMAILEKAKSNIREYKDGAQIYRLFVQPSVVDLLRVGAHYAVTSLYEEYPEDTKMYSYTVKSQRYEHKDVGRLEMAVGRADVKSDITLEENQFDFAALHFGDHNFICGVDFLKSNAQFEKMHEQILEAFSASNVPEVINLINQHFAPHIYSLRHLFKQEQQAVLNRVLQSTMDEIEASFRQIYEHHYPLMQVKNDIQAALPKALTTIVEFVLNRDLCDLLERDEINLDRLKAIVREVKKWSFERDRANLCFIASKRMNNLMVRFLKNPEDKLLMDTIDEVLRNLGLLELELDLWLAQNIYFALGKQFYQQKKDQANNLESAREWIASFNKLGDILKVKVE